MKGFLVTLLVLVVLLVGADFGARWIAEDRVATQLQSQLKLDEKPDVAIHGFPFVTQAASGDYGVGDADRASTSRTASCATSRWSRTSGT